MKTVSREHQKTDPSTSGLLLLTFCLLGLGLITILSTSYFWTLRNVTATDGSYLFQRQLVFVLFGLFLLWSSQKISIDFFYRWSWWFYWSSLLLLLLVLIPGIGTKEFGARRWIRIGSIGIQPSELAKLSTIFVLARIGAESPKNMRSFYYGFMRSTFIISLPCLLILAEPNLSTAGILGVLGVLVAIAGGVRLLHVLPFTAFAGTLSGMLLWNFHEHFQRRIEVFLDPGQDPLGTEHQLRQSLIALGSGGLTGKGLGQSLQKLFFLPQHHSDFVFAIIGEELGYLGASFTVLLYLLIFVTGLYIAHQSRDIFHKLLALGITLTISLQALLNISVVTGLFPTTGMPLPFISYGGSSLLMSLVMMGLLISISRSNDRSRIPPSS